MVDYSKIKEIEKKVLKKITPVDNKDIELANEIKSLIEKKISEKNYNARVVLGGSIAKNTYLRDDHDVDIFVCFDKSYENTKLSDYLEEILRQFKPERIHGSRDYFNFFYKGVKVEIVPAYHIKNYKEAENITDMSPLHVDWVLAKLKHNPSLPDEIRLAKMFCKANDVYGAESYIRGFSGHVLDILLVFYQSFIELLKNAVDWREREVIDVENHYKGNKVEINKSKISPLIVVDPVDPTRNAAAALSLEKFNKFKQLASKFLDSPSIKFFEKKYISIDEIKKNYNGHNTIIVLEVIPKKGKKDVVGSKLLKVYNYIKVKLKEFEVVEANWQWSDSKAIFVYSLKKNRLPDTYIRKGPPLKAKLHAMRFKEKHPNYFVRHYRNEKFLFAEVKRNHKSPQLLVEALMNEDYIKERVSKIKLSLVLTPT